MNSSMANENTDFRNLLHLNFQLHLRLGQQGTEENTSAKESIERGCPYTSSLLHESGWDSECPQPNQHLH